ncbi:MAG: GGDEF domain-containing protein [Lachnospiraceae bacterium]|nr:GGDEF domain-containing protein [Lachnospiraceae bacterium]
MVSNINLTAVFIADYVGVMLMGLVLLTKGWRLPARREESKILLTLIVATFIDCLIDPFIFIVDGRPGLFNRIYNTVGNSLLFLYNLVMGTGVLALIVKHINKKISKVQYVTVWALTTIETVLLVINLFSPIVFSIDENNVYKRGPCYFVYIIAAFYLIAYSFVVYLNGRIREGALRFFPVWEFLLPIISGVTIQTLFYGVSMQPVCFAVAFCSIVVCLQNEYLFLDKLTGVYNRYELDKIREHYRKRKNEKIAAIMLDMNDFKAINDNYSHTEGDAALVAMADILTGVVQNDGNVIRFAGDEFVIIFNSGEEETIPTYCNKIREALDAYNETSGKPYKLSAAMGGSIFDLNDQTDIISRIDSLMYEDKKRYYETHDRRRR